MKIGILGSGIVGQTLAAGFVKHGHQAMIGTRDPAKLSDWQKQNPKVAIKSVPETAGYGELIVLAPAGPAAAKVLGSAGAANLAGKTILDATNPIADAPPVDGVLTFFTGPNESLMEQLQAKFPAAHFVKAFNSVGAAQMVNPAYRQGPPTMFICGNDKSAKAAATQILQQFGWETADMGRATAARTIEPLAVLWCILGFTQNHWTHAFKLLHGAAPAAKSE